jgi:methyltransferase
MMMTDVVVFLLVFQRIIELMIAKRNEKWIKKRGAIEYGQSHYPFIVCLHILFLLSLFIEGTIVQPEWNVYSYVIVFIIGLLQWARYHVIRSLGPYWNTKIFILPKEEVCQKGLYQWMKHPNYVIVTLEFIFIPLLLQAYVTLVVFSILNAWILSIRIREENKALALVPAYQKAFSIYSSFFRKGKNDPLE